MKKIILLLSVIVLLVSLIGCSDDSDGGNSSLTGVDFTSDAVYGNIDYYLFIDGTGSDFKIVIASKDNVNSSELIINGAGININSNWNDISLDFEDFTYGVFIDESMLPETLIIAPGVELAITLKINGKTYAQTMTVAEAPVVQNQTVDLEKDFTITWSSTVDSDTQIVDFYGASYVGDNEFDLGAQVAGDSRSYTFSKSNYSQFVLGGLSWFEYGVDAMNYKNFGKTIFVLSSSNYVDSDNFKTTDVKDTILNINSIIKTLVK